MMQLHCDFCYGAVDQGQETRIYAKTFEQYVMQVGKQTLHVRSIGDWCACPVCVTYLVKKDWDGLTERVVKIETILYGMDEFMVRDFIKRSWEKLRANLEVIE